jgi:two-component system, chemotaxis family, protein-glutamate methylesterase/glutaminase
VGALRVLVADDSILFRRVISDVLSSLPDVEVVGSASNGKLALQKVREMKPDLLTLDMEMPEMDGLAVLDALRAASDPTSVIVVSALTRKGGQLTMKALERGAFDFITKPETSNAEQGKEAIKRELAPRVKALAHRREIRSILRRPSPSPAAPGPGPRPSPLAPMGPAATTVPPTGGDTNTGGIAARMNRIIRGARPEMVLIGVSTGGPPALSRVLPEIPATIGVPILIVQHMPPLFTASLAESLRARCTLGVREAADGDVLDNKTIYIAPGGRQMRVAVGADGARVIQITDDPPENNCRPAVDYLFRSVANTFPGRSMAVVLTGMGSDGTLGVRLLKRQGCFVIAQDEATCVVYGMPKAVVDAGVADAVLPLDAIAARITNTVRGIAG